MTLADAPQATAPEGWQHVQRPPSLFRRFDFAGYAQTRDFLARLAALSERDSLYPDLGFGPRHVNVTVHAAEAGLGARECGFADAASAAAAAARQIAP